MEKLQKEALQVSKEIVVKFIETGRVSPANFAEVFPSVHKVVRETVLDAPPPPASPGEAAGAFREK
jgi:hypothetical protein